ncbi:class I SAM-dependent methyltransferase [Marivirga tractuosa]|uniref:class I SAM-dependent methyltransferase n=1 Tax=Marivirga tractuosa TaxID=1006 RepID=UPI0035D05237
MADFNRISSLYDFLKILVFGKQLEKASNHFLNQISSNSSVLIIGGGTGKILRNFSSTHQIKYLELSEAMIRKAKKINSEAKVEFIQADILKWVTNEKYDLIVTSFVLDCFNDSQLNEILPKLKNILKRDGKWIQTDFYPKSSTHKLLIKIMYVFFNITTNLNVKKLADFNSLFEKHNFIFKRNALFYHSMVESKIYQKID